MDIGQPSIQPSINAKYIVVPIIVVELILQWYSHSSGLLLTDDSYHYIHASQGFKNYPALIDNQSYNLPFEPPLFPIILSIIGPSGRSLIWINMILVVIIAVVIFNIINRIIKTPVICLLCFTYIILGVHILLISSFLWSELIFLFFSLLFINTLLKSKKNIASLYFAIIIGFFMCIQRNAGLFIVTGAAIWIFVNENNGKTKFIKSIAFFLCATSGSLIWNIYAWFFVPHEHVDVSGKLFQHIIQNTNSVAQAIIKAFLPIDVPIIPFLIIVFSALFYSLRAPIRKSEPVQLIFITSVIYLIFLNLVIIINVAGFVVDYGEGDRFISVIMPFLSILFFKSFETFFEQQSNKIKILAVILTICWLSYPIARTIKNAVQWHKVSSKNAILLGPK